MRSPKQGMTTRAWLRRASRAVTAALTAAVLGGVACTDASGPPPTSPSLPSFDRSEGRGIFQRYVALGSGMSMGWRSDGVTTQSQYDSWPAQLARIAHRELDQPYVASPSCLPPWVGPFQSLTIGPSGPCANQPGVRLPEQNLGIHGATVTSALAALVGDASLTDSGYGWSTAMRLVLPSGVTQVGAVHALNPRVVSVEFGVSELVRSMLPPYAGAVRPAIAVGAWMARYRQILDEVTTSRDMVVLALPPLTPPPGFVSSDYLVGGLSSAQALTAFNVAPPPQPCEIFPPGYVYVPRYLPLVIGEALAARANGLGPVPLNCNLLRNRLDLSFSTDWWDVVGGNAYGMRSLIRAEAEQRGFAVFDLQDLYSSYTQPPFSVFTFWSSSQPFGPYVSLDGIYPTAAGNRLLAEAAARALNTTYNLGLSVSAP